MKCLRCGSDNVTISSVYVSLHDDPIPKELKPREAVECEKCGFFTWLKE